MKSHYIIKDIPETLITAQKTNVIMGNCKILMDWSITAAKCLNN